MQVYIGHLLILYAINDICGIDKIALSFGLGGDLWCVLFPIVEAIPFTAILAISKRPNEWASEAKDWVVGRVLNPQ